MPPDVPAFFVPRRGSLKAGESLLYRPAILGVARLHYADKKAGVDHWETLALVERIDDEMPAEVWSESEPFDDCVPELDKAPEAGARFASLPAELARGKSYAEWTKSLKNYLYRERTLRVWTCPELKSFPGPWSRSGSSGSGWSRRRAKSAIRKSRCCGPSTRPSWRRSRRRSALAYEKLEREQAQASRSTWDATIAMGSSVLGALMGRKTISKTNLNKATTAAKAAGRALQQRGDVSQAGESVEVLQRKYADLQAEFQSKIEEIHAALRPEALELEPLSLRPKKTDITVEKVVLAWMPYLVGAEGKLEPAY